VPLLIRNRDLGVALKGRWLRSTMTTQCNMFAAPFASMLCTLSWQSRPRSIPGVGFWNRGWQQETDDMEQILINLIAGALGGAGAGKASPSFDLGTVGNIVSGLVGGGVLGQIVSLAMPAVTAAATTGNFSIGSIISHIIAGGAGGAILTALVGAIKNKAAA
jgi:hypothetical protein